MESFTIGRDHAFFMTTDREYKEVDDALMEAVGALAVSFEFSLSCDACFHFFSIALGC